MANLKSNVVLVDGEQTLAELKVEKPINLGPLNLIKVVPFVGGFIIAIISLFMKPPKGLLIITNKRIIESDNKETVTYVIPEAINKSLSREIGFVEEKVCGCLCPSYTLFFNMPAIYVSSGGVIDSVFSLFTGAATGSTVKRRFVVKGVTAEEMQKVVASLYTALLAKN